MINQPDLECLVSHHWLFVNDRGRPLTRARLIDQLQFLVASTLARDIRNHLQPTTNPPSTSLRGSIGKPCHSALVITYFYPNCPHQQSWHHNLPPQQTHPRTRITTATQPCKSATLKPLALTAKWSIVDNSIFYLFDANHVISSSVSTTAQKLLTSVKRLDNGLEIVLDATVLPPLAHHLPLPHENQIFLHTKRNVLILHAKHS
jgi:hypothetical protein